MTYVIQFIVCMLAIVSFAIIYSAPMKEVFLCGLTGAIGWIVYYAIVYGAGRGNVFASLIATLILTIFARSFAVIRKRPVTLYLLTGIFPLVPGAGIYYTAFYLITGDSAAFSSSGINTFEVAAAIVFGIIFGFAVPQSLLNKLPSKK